MWDIMSVVFGPCASTAERATACMNSGSNT